MIVVNLIFFCIPDSTILFHFCSGRLLNPDTSKIGMLVFVTRKQMFWWDASLLFQLKWESTIELFPWPRSTFCAYTRNSGIQHEFRWVVFQNIIVLYRTKRLAPVLIKEITRRVNLTDRWQAVYTAGVVLPKPVGRCRYYHRSLNPKKLIEVNCVTLSCVLN